MSVNDPTELVQPAETGTMNDCSTAAEDPGDESHTELKDAETSLRRSQRDKTLTDKMRAHKEKEEHAKFRKAFNICATTTNDVETAMNEPCDRVTLQTLSDKLENEYTKTEAVYKSLTNLVQNPGMEVRRDMDRLEADHET